MQPVRAHVLAPTHAELLFEASAEVCRRERAQRRSAPRARGPRRILPQPRDGRPEPLEREDGARTRLARNLLRADARPQQRLEQRVRQRIGRIEFTQPCCEIHQVCEQWRLGAHAEGAPQALQSRPRRQRSPRMRLKLHQHPFALAAAEDEVVLAHGRGVGDAARGKREAPLRGLEVARSAHEQHQLVHVVKVDERLRANGVPTLAHVQRAHERARRQLHRLADRLLHGQAWHRSCPPPQAAAAAAAHVVPRMRTSSGRSGACG